MKGGTIMKNTIKRFIKAEITFIKKIVYSTKEVMIGKVNNNGR